MRSIFDAPTREAADRRLAEVVKSYAMSASRRVTWIEGAIPEGLTIFELPEAHCRLLRTTNALENLDKQSATRIRVATLFPHIESLLRLVTVVLTEISEDWESGRIYASMNEE